MVATHMEYHKKAREEAAATENIRRQLEDLDVAYGDAPRRGGERPGYGGGGGGAARGGDGGGRRAPPAAQGEGQPRRDGGEGARRAGGAPPTDARRGPARPRQ